MSIAIAAIVTSNYMCYARTLFASIARWSPASDCYCLVIDGNGLEENRDSGRTTLVSVPEVIDDSLFQELLGKVSTAEICFALKPFMLRYLLMRGYGQVHYFDTDMWLVGPAEPIFLELNGNAICLTSHWTKRHGRTLPRVHEVDMLRAGVFNAGYVGVSQRPEAIRFLDWWKERILRWGYNDRLLGLSGDQKWLDPVPILFDGVRVSEDIGVNVGYWNLAGVPLRQDGELTLIDDQPLRLLHLSGFDPEQPGRLSRFANDVDVASGLALQALLVQYAQQLISNGYLSDQTGIKRIGLGRRGGSRWARLARSIYRAWLLKRQRVE